ncbi:MAG: formate dehydrogenase accessory sulfurtransferase FdhD [Deltaproteobacteria bacterium]|nr:formate dehydrogenase accessory sulfurtransferase FdhD [Deltaproteobacteria bacterium]
MSISKAGATEREVWRDGVRARDAVAVEEPLEIRAAGDTLAITLRTPGDDARLAAGFLFAEGIIRSLDELSSLAHCGRPGDEAYGNVVDARPSGGVVLAIERAQASRRGTLTTAACGLCGRQSVDDLLERCLPLPDGPRIPRAVLLASAARLGEKQALFAQTGGTHAAAAFDAQGELLAAHEDVGRHNAVDKVVGALLYAGLVGSKVKPEVKRPALLVVSSRAGFEVVQKATMARIPVVASLGAASSLAIDLASRANVTLAAFVRGERFNLYSRPERVGP